MKKLSSAQEFVQRLELLEAIDSEPPANSAEAEKIMHNTGVDPKAFLARTRAHIQGIRSKLAEERLAQAAQARTAESARLATRTRSFSSLSLEELKARVSALGASNQGFAVAHKGLTGPASREELEALLAEHEHLEDEK
ncbi:hypothetical protein [Cystobacter fuscus]|uniref:hypothetical protein n=1 Tax=Cystobacter fuscus TaxID=43 RepID=UPI002B280182|nr:hypothetical protein F0U63_41265 [Cystobacter fuscus]